MAQPSGQLLVDAGNPLAGLFFYAQGTNGIWDANNGSLLAKTGTAGVAVEGGANVVLGNAATHYSLAAEQTLTAPFTLRVKARKEVGTTTNSMTCGNYAATNCFHWLDSGSGKSRFRVKWSGSETTADLDSTAAITTTSHSVITLTVTSGGVWTQYQDDAVVGSGTITGTGTPQFILSAICGGYSGGSFRLNGALEFLHAIPGYVATSGEISALNADPYSILQSTGTTVAIDATTALPTFSGSVSAASSGASVSTSSTTSLPTFSGSITGDVSGATITIIDLKDMTSGILRANETGITAIVNNISTGELVVKLTGQTSTVGGDVVLSNVALISATQYRVTLIMSDGSEGTWKYTAA